VDGLEVRELSISEDSRGWLGEIIREDEATFKPLMTYLSMTKPGVVRGPHEHKEQTDFFCLIGRFRLYFWDNRKTSTSYKQKETMDTSEIPVIAVVPPGIVHAYKNIGTNNGYVINLPDKLYKGWGKTEQVDEIRYENDPDNPYRVSD
jgi:dTDP-4-dehydrorhamnose 3,5-epimerase